MYLIDQNGIAQMKDVSRLDATGAYGLSYLISAGLCAVGLVLCMFIRAPGQRRTPGGCEAEAA